MDDKGVYPKHRLLIVAGTRPNFVKVAPLARAFGSRPGFDLRFVNTGQHYHWEMAGVFLADLGLPPPDHDLEVGSGTHVAQLSLVMSRLEPVLEQVKPDLALVVGDVNSTLAAALTAVKSGVPVGHVEAGLRSYDRTMPEEINRVVTDTMSELLFAPSRDAVDNLVREGMDSGRIHLVGNVMIDTLDALLPRAIEARSAERLDLHTGSYAVATFHRPSNVDEPMGLRRMVDLLLMMRSHFPTAFPCHPRTRSRLEDNGLLDRLERADVRIVDPLGYIDFLSLLRTAALVVTDSGGIQEETTVLGIPCITYRATTERPVTVTQGTNLLVSLDLGLIEEALARVAAGERGEPRRPHLWDGHAAERIAAIVEGVLV
jgi:UDP-N-acetylglucosamine 2-epimerase (non-hydrolysing)